MKKIIALAMALIFVLSMFAGCTPAQQEPAGTNKFNLKTVKEGYLTVVTSPDYAPYEFYALDANGKPELAGFDMYLAQYIADYLGLTLDVVTVDFNGIIGEMGAGSADLALAGLSPKPDRAEKMDFSDIYYGGKQAFITTTDKADKFPDLASANQAGITVGAQNGTIQMDLAAQYSPDAQLITLTKATEIIAELTSGKLDGAYVEWDVAESYKKQYPNLHIVCEVPYEEEGNVVGVAKGVDPEIIAGLRANFEGECTEVGMYLAMARVAHREGYPEIGLYWEKAAYEEAEHAAKFAELLGEVVTSSTKKNLEMRIDAENGATQGKFDLAKRAKELNLDAIHDTVHEMARDEARHGKAFEGLLNRYFKK